MPPVKYTNKKYAPGTLVYTPGNLGTYDVYTIGNDSTIGENNPGLNFWTLDAPYQTLYKDDAKNDTIFDPINGV